VTNLYEAGDINTVDGDDQVDINSVEGNAADGGSGDDFHDGDEGNEGNDPNDSFDGGTPLSVVVGSV
jgi:hypothetical protein